MECYTITKDSKLIETYWFYDTSKKEGSYLKREILEVTPHILHDKTCFIEEGVTLKHIFKYLEKEADMWELYVGNWCKLFIEEGIQETITIDKSDPMTSLELGWTYYREKYQDEKDTRFSFDYKMSFNGRGLDSNGAETTYSLSFSPTTAINDIPVIVNTDVIFIETTYEPFDEKVSVIGKQDPTLFQIIYSILWEISFHGEPSKRDSERKILDDIVLDFKKEYLSDLTR